MPAIKPASAGKEAVNNSKVLQCLSKNCGITPAFLNTLCWRSFESLLMYTRSVSNNHEDWSHTKLEVLCDILMRNCCETSPCWPKIARRVGACADEKCKVETEGLQVHVGGRKHLHRVQVKFHTTMVLGLGFGSAAGFLAPGFFKSGTLMSISK